MRPSHDRAENLLSMFKLLDRHVTSGFNFSKDALKGCLWKIQSDGGSDNIVNCGKSEVVCVKLGYKISAPDCSNSQNMALIFGVRSIS